MTNLHESKLDAVLKAIEALTAKIGALEYLALGIDTSPGMKIPQPMQCVAVEGSKSLPSQRNNCSHHNLDGGATKYRKPRISLHEKFDDIQLKFQGFVNQVRFITILQPECYPMEQSQVGIVGTLLTGQALSFV